MARGAVGREPDSLTPGPGTTGISPNGAADHPADRPDDGRAHNSPELRGGSSGGGGRVGLAFVRRGRTRRVDASALLEPTTLPRTKRGPVPDAQTRRCQNTPQKKPPDFERL